MQQPGIATGVDNYDENSETLSAASTLHDTVGICYQNRVVGDSTVRENSSATSKLYNTTKNRKKYFEKEETLLNKSKDKSIGTHVPKSHPHMD